MTVYLNAFTEVFLTDLWNLPDKLFTKDGLILLISLIYVRSFTMESMSDSEDHAIFKTDPIEWMQYVHKEVTVSTTKGSSHRGWVYTVDPVSQTFALIQFPNKDSVYDPAKLNEHDEVAQIRLEMVAGHAIKSILVMDDDTDKHKDVLEKIFQPDEVKSISPAELKKRKDLVKSWLCKNRIPVSLSGESLDVLSISDALFIEPPYGANNCRSTNEIILGRVQGLIKSMPPDVNDW